MFRRERQRPVPVPRRRLAYALAAVAAAVLTMVPGSIAWGADQAPDRATVFERGYDTSNVVTLTMDADWWNPGDVPTVLRILRDNGITAGFALTGRYVDRYPDQTRAIVAAGHKLVNHSYSHPYFFSPDPVTGHRLTQAERWAELDAAEAAYNRLGFTAAGWFRTPYRDGYTDPGVNRDLALRGYYINFDWTFDTTGYLGVDQSVILDRVRHYTVPGAVVLMHLSTESTDTAALPAIISTLRGMGYTFTDPYRTLTRGAVGSRYAALGAQGSVLGAPRTAEIVPASTAGTAVQWFQAGRIYWKDSVGAYEVHGRVLDRYIALGTVNSVLGYPTTDELGTAENTGRFNNFTGLDYPASIYFSPATGAHEIHGLIRLKWLDLGAERGVCGYPTTDELATPDGIGRYNHFGRDASIYFTARTGVHEVHGLVRAKWAALGWERGATGYPISDELATPDGTGRFNNFAGLDFPAWIYFSPATGAHEVHGLIGQKWMQLGGQGGFLGYPTTDEQGVAGGRASQFQGGNVYFSPATGTHEVHGAILGRYLQLGGSGSRLGLPTSDEYSISIGRRSDFLHGAILYNGTTGAITVIYS